MQPKTRAFYYKNMKSAMAEETLLSLLLKEPALFDKTQGLTEQMFSAPVLGKAFAQLNDRYRQGLEVSAGVLADMTAEEMSHLAGIQHRHQDTVSENALADCIQTIRAESMAGAVSTDDDLRALQNKRKEKKGLR